MTEHWLAYLQLAQLVVLAPHHFGGVIVRSRSGPVRDRWLGALEKIAVQQGLLVPLRKIPSNITDENLLGGLDIEWHTQEEITAALVQQAVELASTI